MTVMGDLATQKPTVVITGFGPFASHTVNASWVTVQELVQNGGLGDDVKLVPLEIPVAYDDVSKFVPDIWETYQPKLVVHVGVSGIAKDLTLEQLAHNEGYDKLDIHGCRPESRCCHQGAPAYLMSGIDMSRVCDAVRQSGCGVNAVLSYDPGRYLCDYIYYSSMSVCRMNCAFIHVPPLYRQYTTQQLAESIRVAIVSMLEQIDERQRVEASN